MCKKCYGNLQEDTKKYIIDVLNYLDGRGIVITDEELVEKTLLEIRDITDIQY